MRPALKTRLGAGLSTILALSLLAFACGDSEDSSEIAGAADTSPTLEEDTAAIEKLMAEFGASVGSEACDFYSVDFLAQRGGLRQCRRDSSDERAVAIAVEDVTIAGDAGVAIVTFDGGSRSSYPVARSGEANDAYDGWTIDGFLDENAGQGESPEQPEPGGGPGAPSVTEQVARRAVAYTSCIEAGGATNISQGRIVRELPVVTFSAGALDLLAVFTSSPAEANNVVTHLEGVGLQYAYTKVRGSAVLLTENTTKADIVAGSPPRADKLLAIDCLDQVGA